jgi:hypothetical protein
MEDEDQMKDSLFIKYFTKSVLITFKKLFILHCQAVGVRQQAAGGRSATGGEAAR